MKQLRELLNRKLSKEVTTNWYYVLGASQITASFFAPSDDAQLVLLLMGAIVVLVASILRFGKGE